MVRVSAALLLLLLLLLRFVTFLKLLLVHSMNVLGVFRAYVTLRLCDSCCYVVSLLLALIVMTSLLFSRRGGGDTSA